MDLLCGILARDESFFVESRSATANSLLKKKRRLVGLPRLMDLIGYQAALEYISLNLIDYSIDNQT